MRTLAVTTLLACGGLHAEVRTMTLRQAVELALEQSPDVALARLEEKKAEQSVRQAKDPFVPQLVAGSGLAYSSGFPMSLEVARRSAAGLERVAASVAARVAEGRELPIESRRAALELACARRREQALESQRATLETALAEVLGLEPGDRVQAAAEDRPPLATPASEPEALQAALAHSQEIRLLESKLLAKGYDLRAERAARLPRFDLVAQYSLLSRFNNYEEAESARNLARMDLEVAREQVSLLMAQFEEGRAGLRQIEEARSAEAGKWMAFYDAAAVERARLTLLLHTGALLPALKGSA